MNPLASLAAIQTPDEAQLTTRAQASLRMVESMVIDSQETYGYAADELKAIKAKANGIEAQRTAITGPINTALKAINDLFRGPAQFLSQAESTIKGKMLGYTNEQERIAAAAQRKAEEAAAAERLRLAEEATARQRAADAEAAAAAAAERQRAAEAATAQKVLDDAAAAAKAAGDAQAAQDAAQAAAEARRRDEVAAAEAQRRNESIQQAAALDVAAIRQVADVITAPAVVAAPPKAAGTSVSKTYDFEVTSLLAIVKHVAAHPELISIMKLDEVRTRALVRGLGPNTNVDGLRVFEKKTLSSRSA